MISVFELFKVGIGPSSSHTVGPMNAAATFASEIASQVLFGTVDRVEVRLLGSLAWTGKGHCTDMAVILGLAGNRPHSVEPDDVQSIRAQIAERGKLALNGQHIIDFDPLTDVIFDDVSAAPFHPNTLEMRALSRTAGVVFEQRWCSIGGGFICLESEISSKPLKTMSAMYPFDFSSGAMLLKIGSAINSTIAEIVMVNECFHRSQNEVEDYLDAIAKEMMDCIDRGLKAEGELPGGLQVRRRAKLILDQLQSDAKSNSRNPHEVMDWVSVYAIAVNEENAAGGRVVTAPTNGAAGVVPATMRYYRDHCHGSSIAGMRTFLLTAAAIGGLFKKNASISGAEVGCQGEVGVACSMAAAGLAAALGAQNHQIENAAEIGMEHHLGMTCDPIGGLVQIPCIERNAFGAVSAVNAASLAMRGDGRHVVSLDHVIRTMRDTGRDMQSKYKETSLGGLAVSNPEC
jgi:L-serine dehydratase